MTPDLARRYSTAFQALSVDLAALVAHLEDHALDHETENEVEAVVVIVEFMRKMAAARLLKVRAHPNSPMGKPVRESR